MNIAEVHDVIWNIKATMQGLEPEYLQRAFHSYQQCMDFMSDMTNTAWVFAKAQIEQHALAHNTKAVLECIQIPTEVKT